VNRLSSLISAADKQRRLLWASLPFSTRLAELFFRIAVDPKETFSRIIFTVFVRRGVTGLPPIKGAPAEQFDLAHAPGHTVPPGYGKEFGAKVWATMVAKFKDPEIVADAMQDTALKFTSRPDHLEEGVSLSKAQSYVMTSVSNACQDAYRHRRKHPGDYGEGAPAGGGEEDAPKVDLEDPDSLSGVVDWLNEESRGKLIPALMRDLSRIPGAAEYVQAVIELGLTDNEIVGDYRKGRPAAVPYFQENPMTVQNFGNRVKPKIRQVFQKYVDQLRD
jgi:DNA-directed RNA polymerase specialized sigma24 family protein